MPLDDAVKISALASAFRRKIADATLTLATLKGYADAALQAMLDGTTIINLTNEGGSTGAQITAEPSVVLAAANQVIDENPSTAIPSTGTTFLGMNFQRVET